MGTAAFFPLMGQSGESLNFENDRVFSKQKNKLITLTANRLTVIATGVNKFKKKLRSQPKLSGNRRVT
jgi:hypothetical protein